jgi:O-antigen/teichoic acid export membrane protein
MLRVLIWSGVSGVLFGFGQLFGIGDELMPLISIFIFANLFEGISKTYRSFFQGIEQMKIPSLSVIAEKVFVSVVSIGLLLAGADAAMIAGVFTAGTLLHLLFLWTLSRGEVSISFTWNPAFIGSIKIGLPYFFWSLFSMIYFRVDALMLHAYSSQEVTGWYGGAYRFFDAVMILPALLKVALFPVFSRLAIDSEKRLSDVFEKSLRMVLLVAIPISVLIYIAAAPIIDFFMGVEEYTPSIIILQIFCFGIPMMFADFILGSVLIGSTNRQSAWAGIGFVAILLNVSLNIWLIPLFQQIEGNGGAGAAISTVLTELFILGSALILLPKRYYMSFDSQVYLRLFGLAISVIFMLWGLHHVGIHWFLQAILLSICFGVALIGLRLLSKNERNLFIDFLNHATGFKRGGSSSKANKQEVK